MGHENVNREAPRILIVDDVEENRFVLRDIIMDMGYLPILTENGIQALKMVERYRPQLIISDVAMPEMDGYELCRKIKENADTRDIPIVFISAFDDPSDIVRGFNIGGEDYITKPFIPEVVKARVGVHLKLAEAKNDMLEINRQLQTSVSEQLRQMEMEKKNVLYALLRVIRESVGYDAEYMERVCYDCRTLAEALQLSVEYSPLISDGYIDMIELATPLGGIGKVAIPSDIMQKKENLTPEERELRQKHTMIGAQILGDIKDLGDYNDYIQMAADIANYHHENWDGSGYPTGKSGDEIPLAAQIVAVIHAYCALTDGKRRQEPLKREEALAELELDAGKKYNPEIFKILKKISRQLH
ncbi:MAG: response regulator [Clostridiales bacterium]|nr:response regulator [Roseburia sp.]MDD7636011.1 response regulator [Clostridiales bacterium]MDY4114149.1 response regulator [Roseburia sp.]